MKGDGRSWRSLRCSENLGANNEPAWTLRGVCVSAACLEPDTQNHAPAEIVLRVMWRLPDWRSLVGWKAGVSVPDGWDVDFNHLEGDQIRVVQS